MAAVFCRQAGVWDRLDMQMKMGTTHQPQSAVTKTDSQERPLLECMVCGCELKAYRASVTNLWDGQQSLVPVACLDHRVALAVQKMAAGQIVGADRSIGRRGAHTLINAGPQRLMWCQADRLHVKCVVHHVARTRRARLRPTYNCSPWASVSSSLRPR